MKNLTKIDLAHLRMKKASMGQNVSLAQLLEESIKTIKVIKEVKNEDQEQ